jgi:hypothetical protein
MYTRSDNPRNIIPASSLPTSLPGPVGMVHGTSPDTHWPLYKSAGWRKYLPFDIPEGMVVVPESRTTVDDGDTVVESYEVISVDQHEADNAQRWAEAEAQRQLDKPVELRATENLFLILCAAILTEPDVTKARKLGFQQLPAYLGQAQAISDYLDAVLAILQGYAPVFAGMQITLPTDLAGIEKLAAFINASGVYYNVKWWDDCVLHPELLGAQ